MAIDLHRVRLLFMLMVVWSCGVPQDQLPPTDNAAAKLWGGKGFADRCAGDDSIASKTTFLSVSGAKEEPFRAVALLKMSNGMACSAVLIGPDELVTAAHCFDGGASIVRAEFRDSSRDVAHLEVDHVRIDPVYASAVASGKALASNPGLASNDIAHVTLSVAVEDRDPVRLAAMTNPRRGQLLGIVGYGDIGLGAGTKRFAQSHIGQYVESLKVGDDRFENLLLLDSQSGTGACPGDSGGGVFVKDDSGYALVGLVQGVNDVLYPGFPIKTCERCPRGIGIVTLVK
jgi:hypothetical protein